MFWNLMMEFRFKVGSITTHVWVPGTNFKPPTQNLARPSHLILSLGTLRKFDLIQVILRFDQTWIDDHGCGATKLATKILCITYFFIKPWAVIYPWKPMIYPSKPEVRFPAKPFIETNPHKPLICQRLLQIWKRGITLNQEWHVHICVEYRTM